MDTWPVRLAKGIYQAATLPSDVYAGRAQVPQSANMPGGESTQNIGRVTDLASLASPITPRAVPTLQRPIAPVAPAREALESAENAGFNRAYNQGVEVPPAAVATHAQDTGQALFNAGRLPTDAPRTYGVLNAISGAPSGSTTTIANLHSMRKAFGNIAADKAATDSDRAAAGIAKQHFDAFLGNLDKTPGVVGDPQQAAQILRDAISNSAAGFRSDTIQDIAKVARGNVEASNASAQLGKQIRQGINAALKSGDISSRTGFSPQEIAQAEAVRRAGRTSGMIGGVLGGGGGLGTIISGLMTHGVGPAVGLGLKQTETMAAQRQLRLLDEMVRARSPLGQQTMGVLGGGSYAPNPLLRRGQMLPFMTGQPGAQ
jgi:hypothetical protein